jgi:hypothetical protein
MYVFILITMLCSSAAVWTQWEFQMAIVQAKDNFSFYETAMEDRRAY